MTKLYTGLSVVIDTSQVAALVLQTRQVNEFIRPIYNWKTIDIDFVKDAYCGSIKTFEFRFGVALKGKSEMVWLPCMAAGAGNWAEGSKEYVENWIKEYETLRDMIRENKQ